MLETLVIFSFSETIVVTFLFSQEPRLLYTCRLQPDDDSNVGRDGRPSGSPYPQVPVDLTKTFVKNFN